MFIKSVLGDLLREPQLWPEVRDESTESPLQIIQTLIDSPFRVQLRTERTPGQYLKYFL